MHYQECLAIFEKKTGHYSPGPGVRREDEKMRKPFVLCLDNLPPAVRAIMIEAKPEGIELDFLVSGNEEEKLAKLRIADYIFYSWSPITEQIIDAAPRLKMIQRFGAGLEKIDLDAAKKRGVSVCVAAGVNAVAVAELAITLMLAVYKRLCFAHNSLRAGKWLKWELRTGCYELWLKTVGIIGGGAIGQEVAKRLSHGFECQVLYYDLNRLPPEREGELRMIFTPFEELLRRADVVSLHVPLTEKSRGMIGAKELSLMKPTAVLINTSRGAVVDEQALSMALKKGAIAGAGLDVFSQEPPEADNPLLHMDNVVVTPHNGGGTVDTMRRMFKHVFANIMRVERGEPLPEADVVRI